MQCFFLSIFFFLCIFHLWHFWKQLRNCECCHLVNPPITTFTCGFKNLSCKQAVQILLVTKFSGIDKTEAHFLQFFLEQYCFLFTEHLKPPSLVFEGKGRVRPKEEVCWSQLQAFWFASGGEQANWVTQGLACYLNLPHFKEQPSYRRAEEKHWRAAGPRIQRSV